MVTDTELKQLSMYVNEGYSARLTHKAHDTNPHIGKQGEAWLRGWGTADTDEQRLGRTSPVSLIAHMDRMAAKSNEAWHAAMVAGHKAVGE